MERRQKLLIGALVSLSCGYALDQVYRRTYEQPLAAAERQQEQLAQTLRKGKITVRQQQARLAQLELLEQRSLPRNLERGISAYRNWLLKVLGECGMAQANLDSGTPTPFRQIFYRTDFSLRTQGTLGQVTQFLHRFYGTNYLHKVRSLSLTPLSEGSVDVALTIEALALVSAANEGELANLEGQRSVAALAEFQTIARRNIFRAGDPLAAHVSVSAITTDARDERQAWRAGFHGMSPDVSD